MDIAGGVRIPRGVCELTNKCESFGNPADDRDCEPRSYDDVNSTMSESSSGVSGIDQLGPSKTAEHPTSETRALHGHESDVDSGIVSCRLMDDHTESISSAETTSSRESATNERKWRSSSDPTQCVRFDEQLHLSEESVRRSCRKLFATLYSHRFSYPCCNGSNGIPSKSAQTFRRVPPSNNDESSAPSPHRDESHSRFGIQQTDDFLSGCEIQGRPLCSGKQSLGSRNIFGVTGARGKDFSTCKNTRDTKPQHWSSESNILRSSQPHLFHTKAWTAGETELIVRNSSEKQTNLVERQGMYFLANRNVLPFREQPHHRRLSIDQRLPSASSNGFKSRNTFLPSAQQYSHSSSFTHRTQHGMSLMHKSLSCTVLSPSINLSHEMPRRISDPVSVSICDIPDDCRGRILERTPHHIPQLTARNTMVRAYAHVVPIVSDDPSGRCANAKLPTQPRLDISGLLGANNAPCPKSRDVVSTPSRMTQTKPTVVEIPARKNETGQIRRNTTTDQKSSSHRSRNYYKVHGEQANIRPQRGRSYVNGGLEYGQPNLSAVSKEKHGNSNKYVLESRKEDVFPHRNSPMSHHSKANGSRNSPKMEYEGLENSPKNRFASLPVLNNFACADTKERNLPTNFARGLHQSDFTLYRNRPSRSSSSSRKSLLERIQGLTRSAKNAVQKAFSSERIYRPEREERYEAEGHKLKRSHSFIRGLRERMSKKKNKEKKKKKQQRLPVAQAVTQERLNRSWEEPSLDSGSGVTHVEGQLLQLNIDGSQVIELTKPPSKPYGFFVARGRIRNSRGIFVSRMRDQETEAHLSGLLGIGDEILEIEGLNVKHADILEVNGLMSQRNSLILTVLPYVCRKD